MVEDIVVINENGEIIVKPEINVGDFTKFVFPIIKNYNYGNIARKMFGVEPMPQGAVPIYYPEDIKEEK